MDRHLKFPFFEKSVRKMNGSIEVNHQETGNNEEEVLLGGIWYPWYSHEAKKQLKAAEIYARKLLKLLIKEPDLNRNFAGDLGFNN